MSIALRVDRVVKQFATVRAVDGLSLRIEPGQIFALLGPNGAGKTTTVRMLVGINDPDEGTIAFGDGARTLPPARLGYLPEDRGLYKEIPILRTLTYLGVLHGMPTRASRQAALTWLDRLDLRARSGEKLDVLSKGNQQKVQFISAILHRPAFAILDEPFSGLDPVNQDFFLDLLRELRDQGTTILLSAHQMQLVERLADRILLMDQGRAVLDGTLSDLRSGFGADEKLVLDLEHPPDLDQLAALPAIEHTARTGDRQVTLHVRAGHPLSSVLVALGSVCRVTSVRSQHVSLHDIYVETIRARAESMPAPTEPAT